ncbi:hypothetical protein SAMN04487904_102394 [Actinopolyspora lacussalsi subsp. righensis]|uniref:Uncharacterized protein n=1 Tax=Actinopolyspora righensis TaxID=995060 RepID=A0A1I6YCM9_9ACTN|nr:hypothetical protein SAMN04487904_102394 [Actinopolyspora righensis]
MPNTVWSRPSLVKVWTNLSPIRTQCHETGSAMPWKRFTGDDVLFESTMDRYFRGRRSEVLPLPRTR